MAPSPGSKVSRQRSALGNEGHSARKNNAEATNDHTQGRAQREQTRGHMKEGDRRSEIKDVLIQVWIFFSQLASQPTRRGFGQERS